MEEWGLIELQGEIIDKTGGRLNGKSVGDLHFTLQVRNTIFFTSFRMNPSSLLDIMSFVEKLSIFPNHLLFCEGY